MAATRLTAPRDEPQLPRADRRATGVYYTPAEVVRYIVERSLPAATLSVGPHLSPRVIDLACGAGVFLLEAYEQLLRNCAGELATEERLALLERSIFGIDLDPLAVQKTRKSLALAALGTSCTTSDVAPAIQRLEATIVSGNALLDDFGSLFPGIDPHFDCVVGNPPYVNIREIAKSLSAAERVRLQTHYSTARGNYDLYVLFIERALELLAGGGRLGMIVPNKLACLEYAQPCRKLLLEQTTIEHLADLSTLRVFPAAGVYPLVLFCLNRQPIQGHEIETVRIHSAAELTAPRDSIRIRQDTLSANRFTLGVGFNLESRLATQPLGQVAELHSGASGYTAAALAELLVEAGAVTSPDMTAADFIVSRNVKRYTIALGDVRFLKRRYARPRLPLDSTQVSNLKRRLYTSPKIVIAGMSRRIEAAYDDQGLALGVQVYAAVTAKTDPYFLVAILNSRLMTHLFQTRFAAKRLANGYFSLNKSQLAQLPIPAVNQHPELSRLARQLHDGVTDSTLRTATEAEIDRLTYAIYRLTAAEIAQVEAGFAGQLRIAA